MTQHTIFDNTPDGWLAFELSVLRRLKFRSVVNPFAGEPDLDVYLKRWGIRVTTNDAARWASIKALARVENNTERLSADDIEIILEDAYVPRYKLNNVALRRWFGETDAWWFDNVRDNVDKLDGEIKRSLALNLGMMVGDYALSFNEETREFRQPLSRVFRRLWESEPLPVNNAQRNTSSNQEARDFLAAQHGELLFLRLPRAGHRESRRASGSAWREEWVRGGDEVWDEFEGAYSGRLGSRVQTKLQYLRLVEELLATASHLDTWAIAHAENGFLTTEELADCVGRIRRVGPIYTKDFSELMGARAAIITA